MKFKNLKHFTEKEFDQPDKMNIVLLRELDMLREYLDRSIIITSSTGGTHTEGSQHYLGNAVDIIVPTFDGSPFSLYLIAERFSFSGIGVYPDWTYKGKRIGGLHLDVRDRKGGQGARWIGKKYQDAETKVDKMFYYPLNPENLLKHKIITTKKR